MDATTVFRCLTLSAQSPGQTVLDPFSGAGTTVCAASARGLRGIGLEANPLSVHLSALKLTDERETSRLRDAARSVVDAAQRERCLTAQDPLLSRCFDEPALDTLTALRDAAERSSSQWRNHLLLALLATMRECASVNVGWAYVQPTRERVATVTDAAARFIIRADAIADELDAYPPGWTAASRIVERDARSPWAWRGLIPPGALTRSSRHRRTSTTSTTSRQRDWTSRSCTETTVRSCQGA